jgi:hypothetical protein
MNAHPVELDSQIHWHRNPTLRGTWVEYWMSLRPRPVMLSLRLGMSQPTANAIDLLPHFHVPDTFLSEINVSEI